MSENIKELLPLCHRSSCKKIGADWWNQSTRQWYCRECAEGINYLGYPFVCIHVDNLPNTRAKTTSPDATDIVDGCIAEPVGNNGGQPNKALDEFNLNDLRDPLVFVKTELARVIRNGINLNTFGIIEQMANQNQKIIDFINKHTDNGMNGRAALQSDNSDLIEALRYARRFIPGNHPDKPWARIDAALARHTQKAQS